MCVNGVCISVDDLFNKYCFSHVSPSPSPPLSFLVAAQQVVCNGSEHGHTLHRRTLVQIPRPTELSHHRSLRRRRDGQRERERRDSGGARRRGHHEGRGGGGGGHGGGGYRGHLDQAKVSEKSGESIECFDLLGFFGRNEKQSSPPLTEYMINVVSLSLSLSLHLLLLSLSPPPLIMWERNHVALTHFTKKNFSVGSAMCKLPFLPDSFA